YTEFVNVDELQGRKPNRIAQKKLAYDASERPMTFQIYGHDEERLVQTALRLQELGPDIVDLNMGCYVKDIAERGAGSGMLRQPFQLTLDFYGESLGIILFRKHAARYIAGLSGEAELRVPLLTSNTVAEFTRLTQALLDCATSPFPL